MLLIAIVIGEPEIKIRFSRIFQKHPFFCQVTCRLYLYHMHDGLIMGYALEALDRILVEKLEISINRQIGRGKLKQPGSFT